MALLTALIVIILISIAFKKTIKKLDSWVAVQDLYVLNFLYDITAGYSSDVWDQDIISLSEKSYTKHRLSPVLISVSITFSFS